MAVQSSWNRAAFDAERFRHSGRWFWGPEVLGTILGGVLGTVVTPDNASRLLTIGLPALGALLGVIVPFILVFCWHLFRAPYRQRDEERLKVQTLVNRRPSIAFAEIGFLMLQLSPATVAWHFQATIGNPSTQEAIGLSVHFSVSRSDLGRRRLYLTVGDIPGVDVQGDIGQNLYLRPSEVITGYLVFVEVIKGAVAKDLVDFLDTVESAQVILTDNMNNVFPYPIEGLVRYTVKRSPDIMKQMLDKEQFGRIEAE